MDIAAPIDEVWDSVNRIDEYPAFMDNVNAVTVLSTSESGERISSWSVTLKGSILEWTERELPDRSSYRITFEQVEGDLDIFDGHWDLTARPNDHTSVKLAVKFEIGIPLLAEMLNPVAARALRDNSAQMLREIERRVALRSTDTQRHR
jgi:ribosome-associated toxin RatA of RatAB toxin-antitoxin module